MKAPKYIKDLMEKYHTEPLGTKDSESLQELIFLQSINHFTMKQMGAFVDDKTGMASFKNGVERG